MFNSQNWFSHTSNPPFLYCYKIFGFATEWRYNLFYVIVMWSEWRNKICQYHNGNLLYVCFGATVENHKLLNQVDIVYKSRILRILLLVYLRAINWRLNSERAHFMTIQAYLINVATDIRKPRGNVLPKTHFYQPQLCLSLQLRSLWIHQHSYHIKWYRHPTKLSLQMMVF